MLVGLLGDLPVKAAQPGKIRDLVMWQELHQRRSLLASGGELGRQYSATYH